MAAGSNIRRLAWKRRLKTVQCFFGSLVCSVLLFRVQTWPLAATLHLPVLLLQAGLLLLVILLIGLGLYYWKRAGHAVQGAAGESAVAAALQPLQQSGWTVEYGFCDSRVGDIDVYLVAPSGRAYTLDVKSHGGLVKSVQGKLCRQYGQQQQPFEKDFLEQARKQAIVLKDCKGFRSVTPAIVFSKAGVAVANPVGGVYVWSCQKVVAQLQKLESV